MGEDDDVGSGVGSSDADVVQSSLDAQGDAAGVVDSVASDSLVCVGVAGAGRGRFGQTLVDRRGGRSVGQRPVRAVVVVFVGELVEELLQLGDRGRLRGCGAEPVLHCLLESFDFALGCRVSWPGVLLVNVEVP